MTSYCFQFQIYTSKADSGAVEHGLAYRVVSDLLKDYLEKGFFVYFDHFYTSLKLLQDLAVHKTFARGTVRIDRDFPEHFKYVILEKGDSKFIKNGDVLACSLEGQERCLCNVINTWEWNTACDT